jgi:hypothetical protein
VKEVVALFACPASLDGKSLGPEMTIRVRKVAEVLKRKFFVDVLIASTASGFSPNELYSSLVRDTLVDMGISKTRIKICHPSASTVAEVDGFEKYMRENMFVLHPRVLDYLRVYVAAGWYQVYRTRFIWWWRHHRKTESLFLEIKGVPTGYLVMRCLMEPAKFAMFLLPTKLQDMANHRIFGPRGL